MNLRNITTEQIDAMSYNELIGLVQETNRPPGGLMAVQEIALRSFLTRDKRVLEIGTSTGFTAIELARLTEARITAIDINPASLAVASDRAERCGVSDHISFEQQDATALTYADKSFDVVFCGNVTSLVSNREAALGEYVRVLRTGGILVAIPMYYLAPPSKRLVKEVSKAIQVNITPMYKSDWVEFFDISLFHSFWSRDYAFSHLSSSDVQPYIEFILARPHLRELKPKVLDTLQRKYAQYLHLFRENLSHMGFTIMLLRKELADFDPELFVAHEV